jgi:hypothetical protein
MARVDNGSVASLRAAIQAGHEAFLAALMAAADRWEDDVLPPEVPARVFRGDTQRWTPRYACFHVLRSSWQVSELVAEHLRCARAGEAPPSLDEFRMAFFLREPEHLALWDRLRDAATARATAIERGDADGVLADVTDADLELPAEMGEFNVRYIRSFGVEDVPATVRSLLTQQALHLQDHAEQMQRALG